MAFAGGNGNDVYFNPAALEGAINGLTGLQPDISKCRAESDNHHDWAWNLVQNLREQIGADIDLFRNGLASMWDLASQAIETHERIFRDFTSVGGPIAAPIEEGFSHISGNLGNGKDLIEEALGIIRDPEHILTHATALFDVLGRAKTAFESAEQSATGLISKLSQMLDVARRIINDFDQHVGEGIHNVIQNVPMVAGIGQDVLTTRDFVKQFFTGAVEEAPTVSRQIVDGLFAGLADIGTEGYDIGKSFFSALLDDLGVEKMGKLGIVGDIGILLASVPAVLSVGGRVMQGEFSAYAHLFQGINAQAARDLQNVSTSWANFADDAHALGSAIGDAAKVFIDVHGMTILEVSGLVLAGTAITIATGGADLLVAPEILGLAATVDGSMIPETFMWETMMDDNGSLGTDWAQLGKDLGRAQPLLYHGLQAGFETVAAPVEVTSDMVHSAAPHIKSLLENAASRFAQMRSK